MTRPRLSVLSLYYVLLLALLYLPIGLLFLFSVNDGVVFALPLSGLTTRWYSDMIRNTQLLEAARNSAVVAVGSSLAATALGTAAAIALVRFKFRGKLIFLAVALMPLLVPFLILGGAMLILYSALRDLLEAAIGLELERSLLLIGLSHTVVSLPYTLLIVMARLVGFDAHLEEAAQDLGASYFYTLRRVILPLIAPAMLAAWLVAYTISFDEFVLASLLVGREPTFPVYLLSQLRFATKFPQVVALAVIVMVMSLILVVLALSLQRAGTQAALNRRVGGGE